MSQYSPMLVQEQKARNNAESRGHLFTIQDDDKSFHVRYLWQDKDGNELYQLVFPIIVPVEDRIQKMHEAEEFLSR